MIFKDNKKLDKIALPIGMAQISTFSSIRALAKMGIPFEGMVMLKQLISEIECMCWAIVPLALEMKHKKECDEQIESLEKNIKSFIDATAAMRGLMQAFKETENG